MRPADPECHSGPEIIVGMGNRNQGALTPEIREEIERLLRAGGDGLSHGAVFCLREQGLSVEEIPAKRKVSFAETKKWIESVDHLLGGTIPASGPKAERNSYAYRYLLWCSPSEGLLRYAKARPRDLQEVNPKISFEPMPPRGHQYGKGQGSCQEEQVSESCRDCGLVHVGECPW
jgi:hypothetical protein